MSVGYGKERISFGLNPAHHVEHCPRFRNHHYIFKGVGVHAAADFLCVEELSVAYRGRWLCKAFVSVSSLMSIGSCISYMYALMQVLIYLEVLIITFYNLCTQVKINCSFSR